MTRIFENPAKGATDDSRIWANLDATIHWYFFRKVLAGSPGTKQAIINIFFQKFHDACRDAGIQAEWSLENEIAVRKILNNLNFNAPRPRRTNNSAPLRKSKSVRSDNVAGGTH